MSINLPPSGIPPSFTGMQQIHGPKGPQPQQRTESTPPPVKSPGTEAQLLELVHDRVQIQQALVRVHLPPEDLQFFNTLLDKAGDHQYKPSSEEMSKLKQIVSRTLDKLNGRPQVSSQHIHAAAKQVVQAKGQELAEVIKGHPELKLVTRKSFGPFSFKQNTRELTATRERLKGELAAMEQQSPQSPDAIRLKKAEIHLVEKAIVKRTDARLPELGSQLQERVDSLSSKVARHFVAEHGSKFSLGFFGRRDADKADAVKERLAMREAVLRDIVRKPPQESGDQDAGLGGIEPMFTHAEREANKEEADLEGISDLFQQPEPQVLVPEPQVLKPEPQVLVPEDPSRLRGDMTSNPTGQTFGENPFDPLANAKKAVKEAVTPVVTQHVQELATQAQHLAQEASVLVGGDGTPSPPPTTPHVDPSHLEIVDQVKVVAMEVQQVVTEVASDVADAVKPYSPMVLPDADAVLTKGAKGSVKLTAEASNLGGSDWSLAMGVKYRWETTNEVLTGQGRTKHVRNKGVGVDVTVRGPGLTFGVGGGRGVSSIFLRQVRERENPETLRTTVEPPSKEDVGRDPVRALKQVGDTAIFSTHMDIRASVGYLDPTGFHVSATASYANEYRIGIQRHGDDPPTFRVRLEPESNSYTGDVSTGWGPFSVTGGGGKHNAVFYEFEMTETALQDTLRSGKFPVVPNLQTYLDKGTRFTPEMFAAFDQVNDQAGGIRLVEFGAQKGTELHADASVMSGAIARVRGEVRTDQELVLTRGEAVQKTSHTTSLEVSALLKGSRTEANHQAHFFSSKVSADGQSMERTYACMMGSYRLTDTDSDRTDIETRMVKINQLLGRTGDNAIRVPPQGQLPVSFARATASLSVNVTREHLQRLAALDLNDRDTDVKLRAIAFSTGLEPDDLLQLVKDLQPRAIERANPDALREDVLRLGNTAREEQILGLQGARVAKLLDSKGLQGLAALDRLLGGNVASFSLTSNAYDQRLNDLGIGDFKAEVAPGKVWASFQALAAKRSVVLELQAGLDGPDKDLVTPQEHADLQRRIDGHLDLLAKEEAKMMATPQNRKAIMVALASRDGLSIGSPETQGIKAMIMATMLGGRGDRLDTIGTSIATLLEKAEDPAEQAAQLDLLLKGTHGRIGIPQTLALFARARADGTLDEVMKGIKAKRFTDLALCLSDAERAQFLADCGPSLGTDARQAFDAGKTRAEALSRQHIGAMKPLMEEIIARVPDQLELGGKAGYDLVDVYKPLARDFRRLGNLDAYIRKDPMLTQGDHAHVGDLARTGLDKLEARLQTLGTELTETQRADLFKHLLDPRWNEGTGRGSHELMDRLIKVDAANPQQRQLYVAAMLANVSAEGGLVFSGLQALQEAAPQALKETLAAITPEQVVAMAGHPDVDAVAVLEMVIKQGTPQQVQALRGTKPEYTKLESEFKDLKATLARRRDWGGAWQERKLAEYRQTKAEMRAHGNQPTLPGQGLVPSAAGFMAMGRAFVDAMTPDQVTTGDVRAHDLKHFQELAGLDVELRNLQGKRQSSTLPEPYLRSLDGDLQLASARTRSRLGELSRMAPDDRQAMLTELVSQKLTPQNQTLIGSLIAEARKDPAELTACTEILFRSAGDHASDLLQMMRDLGPTERQALFAKIEEPQLKTWAAALAPGERKSLLHVLATAGTPEQMLAVRRRSPEYKEATAALTALNEKNWPGLDLPGTAPYDQVKYLKDRQEAMSALKSLEQTLSALGEEYLAPHRTTIDSLGGVLRDQGDNAMKALPASQKQALFQALTQPSGVGNYIGPKSQALMDTLIADSASDPAMLNSYARLLMAAPPAQVEQQLTATMAHLAPAEQLQLFKTLIGTAGEPSSARLLKTMEERATKAGDLQQLRQYAEAYRAVSVTDRHVELLRTCRQLATLPGGKEAVADLLELMVEHKGMGRSADLTNFAKLLDRTQITELIGILEDADEDEVDVSRSVVKLQKQLMAKTDGL